MMVKTVNFCMIKNGRDHYALNQEEGQVAYIEAISS